ncbi:SGNH hydrolase-type esterase domain-containing protein [Chaetomium sp. MPI-SDFR-AT-0129]|nr:SGNH hydrolase-type esterase domain-containing protein [Chaetomium sp. MPI-SDFR-AT-0129]
MKSSVVAGLLASGAAAQSGAWGQCGGIGFAGAKSCVSGYNCAYVNDWYSQCQPGAAATTLATSTTSSPHASGGSTTTSTPPTSTGAAGVRYLGRVNPNTKELSWPGSGISFTFTGTSATIGIASVSGTNSVDLVVDGGAPVVITSFGSSITTPAGLSQGTHTVTLRKRSEPSYGSISLGSITTNGAFVAGTVPTRQIEIIGDSITVGYGLDGTNPCTNSAAVEDNPKTYGALAAAALGADYSVIAWSGKGVVRNIATGSVDTSPLIPELYTRYGANDADNSYTYPSTWSPHAVVINLGTNDFSYISWDASGNAYPARDGLDIPTYTNGLVSFVQSIQTHYPNAHFFLVGSPMLSDYYPAASDAQKTTQTNALKSAVAKLGAKAHFVDWPTQGSDVGCDYHPNAATHAAEGTVLAQAIKSALGW